MTEAAIYTDGVHLACTDLQALHRFARRIGLRRGWFQDRRYPHYDLTTERMGVRAIRAGRAAGVGAPAGADDSREVGRMGLGQSRNGESDGQARQHSGSELRGMITSRQRELEEIAIRCARAGYASTAESVGDAIMDLLRAKTKIARVEAKD